MHDEPQQKQEKRPGHGLRNAGITLGLIACAVMATLFFFPWERLSPYVGERAAAALGRDLRIDGTLDIDWGYTTTIHATRVRLANLPGSEEADMFSVERLDMKIKPLPLLIGHTDIPELRMVSPRLVLEKKADGTQNWDLPAFSKDRAAVDAALPDDRHDFPAIGALLIKDGRVLYHDEEKEMTLDLAIDSAIGEGDEDESLRLQGTGSMQDQKFEVAITGGSIETLRDTNKEYPLDLKINMGPTSVAVAGTFRDLIKLTGINARLDLKGNNMADLFYLTGIPLPPTPPYDIGGTLKKDNDVWEFSPFTGRVGDSDLSGALLYDLSGERGRVAANLTSNLLDIDDLGGFIGVPPDREETAAPEQRQEAARNAAKSTLFPDVQLKVERLRAADMDVTLKAKAIDSGNWPINDMDARFLLDNGLLNIEPLRFGVAGGNIEGLLRVDAREDVPAMKIDVDLKRLGLKPFFSDSRFEAFAAGNFGGGVELEGRGRSLAQVLADSDGRIAVVMGGGEISLTIVEGAGIDIAELTPLLLGEDQTTRIRCAVGDFKVNNGLLTSDIFLFDTADSNIAGDAKIDLARETINAQVEASPKDVSLLAARTPITVSGPLKKPNVGINPSGIAMRGAGAVLLSAVLTPAAAVIPFIELGMGEDSDCGALIAQARAGTQ